MLTGGVPGKTQHQKQRGDFMPMPENLPDILRRQDRVLVAAHAHPDGDAVGASAAMGWMLRALDRNVLLYNESGFPGYLDWLRLPSPVMTRVDELPCAPSLIVALDSGDAARLGSDIQPLLATVPVVNIDHHPGNPEYGTLANWVDPSIAATGQMVGLLAEALGVPLHGALGEAVYVSLVSDTGSFAFGNTSAECLRLAARLVDAGLDVAAVRARLDNTWSEAKMRLWGLLMKDVRVMEEGRLAVAVVTSGMLEETGAVPGDAEGFVEQMRRVRGVRVSLLLRETEADGRPAVRISLRSGGEDDVRAVAAQFGGGGHRNAAGATLPLTPDRALPVVLPYVRHVWNRIRL